MNPGGEGTARLEAGEAEVQEDKGPKREPTAESAGEATGEGAGETTEAAKGEGAGEAAGEPAGEPAGEATGESAGEATGETGGGLLTGGRTEPLALFFGATFLLGSSINPGAIGALARLERVRGPAAEARVKTIFFTKC